MEIPHIAVMRGPSHTGARDDVPEPLVVPQAPRERVDDRPPPHALAVEVEGLAQAVDAAADPPRGIGVGGELRTAVAQQRGDVEARARPRAAWVDRQPGPARGAQDVAAVEVLVEEDRVAALRAGREQLADPADGAVEQPAVEGSPVAVPAHGQLVRPAPGLAASVRNGWPADGGFADQRRRSTGGGLQVGPRLVRDAPQPVARRAALDEQRAAPGIRREQPDRAGRRPSAPAPPPRARSRARGS